MVSHLVLLGSCSALGCYKGDDSAVWSSEARNRAVVTQWPLGSVASSCYSCQNGANETLTVLIYEPRSLFAPSWSALRVVGQNTCVRG